MLKTKLFVTFCILWVLDIIFTLMFVSSSGLDAEANPVMRFVLTEAGDFGFVALKLALLIPFFFLHKHIKWWIYLIMVCVMLPVATAGGHMALNPM